MTTPLPTESDRPSEDALRIAAESDATPEQVEAGRRLAVAGLIAALRQMAEEDRAEEEAA